MRILHYSLGLPPYRTGGLTKYSNDLMQEQIEQGDIVYLLFPGYYSKSKDSYIKKYRKYKGINVFEIINPLPVPLLMGIKAPKEFMKPTNKEIYEKFLYDIDVNIVHIHTFMGLHIEFLEACKKLGVKVVYTTHDYFGLCPKVNFIDNNNELCHKRNSNNCALCNLSAISTKKIKILQGRPYRTFKNFGGIDLLKKIINKVKSKKSLKEEVKVKKLGYETSVETKEMLKLLDYYLNMFKLIDFFIFNSSIAKEKYNKYFKAEGKILSITHKHIKDKRKIREYRDYKLKVSYLGPNKHYKGFNILVETMNSLYKKGYRDIILNMYGDESFPKDINNKNIINNGRYKYNDLTNIFNETDVLVIPSIWYETFGFIVLEALSHGVPVIVTNKVGSKDILINNTTKGIVINDTSEALEKKLIEIFNDKAILENLNNKIVSEDFNHLISKHCKEVKSIYIKILGIK